jgi:hypothetical protein
MGSLPEKGAHLELVEIGTRPSGFEPETFGSVADPELAPSRLLEPRRWRCAATRAATNHREKEYDEYLEGEVRRGTGLTVAEFVRAYEAGELDDADPAVSDLVGLLRIGQNGDRAA